ncbi:DUF4352 domain-containing protein [Paenibacillus psychroresistens]|uniref:DUF4352 domain-containing protein n=1 Tax=Paenibacillus psychroresistens TaxID=1778678 RepID=UPI00139101A2|nr:DUF4352 domain-containing protein [Paenibacillus psychroresistens]
MKKAFLGVILLVVLTACTSTTGESANPDTPKESAAVSEASATPLATPVATPVATAVATPEPKKTLKVGEKFTLKDWEVTVESTKFDKDVSDDFMSSSADEGSKFLVLRLAVKNNGTEDASFVEMFGGTEIKAVYNSKYEYTPSTTLIKGDLSHESISPLKTSKGFSVIEVPDEVVTAKEGIVVSFELDGESKTVLIR